MFQPGATTEANAAPNIVSTNLLINLDGNNTSSLAASSPTSWTSVSPASSAASGTITNMSRFSSGGISGLESLTSSNGGKTSLGTSAGTVSGAITVETWVNASSLRTSSGLWNVIASKWFNSTGTNATTDWHLSLYGNGTGVKLRLDTAGNTSSGGLQGSTTLTTANLNTWYLVGFTVSSTGTAQLYINGQTDGSAVAAGVIAGGSDSHLWVGDGRAQSLNFVGKYAKFRVYNRALSGAEMLQNYQADSAAFVGPTVTFKANDGAATSDTTQTIPNGTSTALTANAFTRSGYTFAGWNTAANGSGTAYSNQQSVIISAPLDLYAQWTPAAPVNTAVPALSGTAKVGQTLTAAPGTWTSGSTPSYAYQWQESVDGSTWTNIDGATASTFTPTTAQAAEYVRTQVTATNSGGSTTSSSAATALVLSANSVTTAGSTANTMADLAASVPNDSNTYNVTIVSSNLANGKLKWSSTPSNVVPILGRDASGSSYLPDAETTNIASTWWSTGYPIISLQGTGANLRTALAALTYTSTSMQTDVVKLTYAAGASTSDYSTTIDTKNYLPVYDNSQLTFHYYTWQSQTAANWTSTQASVRAKSTIDGVTSPNKWYLMTPRYWVEDARGWYLMGTSLTRTQTKTFLGGTGDAGSNYWYYPANTDGYSSATNFSKFGGSTSGLSSGENGLYVQWIWWSSSSATNRAQEYFCNGCGNSGGLPTQTDTDKFGWAEASLTELQAAYIAETYSTTPLNTGSTGTGVQTVRTVTAPGMPTGLTATAASATSVNLSWTAPGSSGSDALTDYVVQTSTDNSTWSTFADGTSTATTATVTGLSAGTLTYFRVAAKSSLAGSYTSATSLTMPRANAPVVAVSKAGSGATRSAHQAGRSGRCRCSPVQRWAERR